MPNQALPGKNKVDTQIVILAPAAKVWEVLADFNGMYTWAPSIEDTQSISELGHGVSAARRNTAKGFGTIDQHVTEWTDGIGFTYRVDAFGPFEQTHTTYRLRATSDGTSECRLLMSYDLLGGSEAATPSPAQMSAKLEASLQQILVALKHRVESGELVRPYKTATP